MPNHQMSPLEADVQACVSATDEQMRAWRHKDRIERYWRGRGRIVHVRVVEVDARTFDGEVITAFALVSDMIDGLPPQEARA